MKYILVLTLSCLIACTQNHKRLQHIQQKSCVIDTSRYTILKFDNRSRYLFEKDVKPETISANEVTVVERLLDSTVNAYNKIAENIYKKDMRDRRYTASLIIDERIKGVSKYKRQLIAVINDNGEKLVWVNCFNSPFDDKYWKKEPVIVMDGGSRFFRLKINLTQEKVYYFRVNGPG